MSWNDTSTHLDGDGWDGDLLTGANGPYLRGWDGIHIQYGPHRGRPIQARFQFTDTNGHTQQDFGEFHVNPGETKSFNWSYSWGQKMCVRGQMWVRDSSGTPHLYSEQGLVCS